MLVEEGLGEEALFLVGLHGKGVLITQTKLRIGQ